MLNLMNICNKKFLVFVVVAKVDKNWTLSDQIRDALKSKGFEIKDGKEGSTWLIN